MTNGKSETGRRAATRQHLIEAALRIVEIKGTHFVLLDVTRRAKLSEGVIYNHFADKTELLAAATGAILTDHVNQVRLTTSLPAGLLVWLHLLSESYRLMSVIGTLPIYREGMKKELQRKLRESGADSTALAVAVVYGSVLEAAGTLRPRDETPLLAILMRACGLRARVSN